MPSLETNIVNAIERECGASFSAERRRKLELLVRDELIAEGLGFKAAIFDKRLDARNRLDVRNTSINGITTNGTHKPDADF